MGYTTSTKSAILAHGHTFPFTAAPQAAAQDAGCNSAGLSRPNPFLCPSLSAETNGQPEQRMFPSFLVTEILSLGVTAVTGVERDCGSGEKETVFA